jgi:hypothetical protein
VLKVLCVPEKLQNLAAKLKAARTQDAPARDANFAESAKILAAVVK